MSGPSRRHVLAGLSALGLLPTQAFSFGQSSKVDIAELDLGPGTKSRAGAWTRLLSEVRLTTSVETREVLAQGIVRIRPDDPALFEHPFIVCLGDGPFAIPDTAGLEQLQRYLAYGGFLLFDDMTGGASNGFDQSVRRLVRALFPTRTLAPLPKGTNGHSVYRAFFLLRQPMGRVARFDDMLGITLGSVRRRDDITEDTTITPLMYMRNDLSGALDRDRAGRHPHPVVPGGERQRREAVKLGINLIMYSLTANYKKDQVHVKELLQSRRMAPQ